MTESEVIRRALRLIGVTAHDDSPTADQMAIGGQFLAGLYDEIVAEFWTTVDDDGVETVDAAWTLATVPTISGTALAQALASDIAATFQKQAPPRGWLRLGQTLRQATASEDEAYF